MSSQEAVIATLKEQNAALVKENAVSETFFVSCSNVYMHVTALREGHCK